MDTYLITRAEIEAMAGLEKTHFLNPDARRNNKSLGDATGLTALGFHIIVIPPGKLSSECHMHYHEEECVYVLDGSGTAVIGKSELPIGPGDFIGYRAGGEAHMLINDGDTPLCCIVAGLRLEHDVADYVKLGKRLYRQRNLPWNLVDIDAVVEPVGGRKA